MDGFLSRGVTIACLKEVEKWPSLKERLAGCEISSAKTPGQALMREERLSRQKINDLVHLSISNRRKVGEE